MPPSTTDDTTMPAEPVRSDLAIRLDEMELERAQGTTAERPQSLPIAGLVLDDAFRLRIEGLSANHVGALELALDARGELDAVLVLPCGASFYLVDGRHRLEAYRRAKRGMIPVRYFLGAPKDARAEAIKNGCKVSLPLSRDDREEAARLSILSGLYSPKAVMKLTGISRRLLDVLTSSRATGPQGRR